MSATPSYNQGAYIGRTIDSILSQQGDFELDYRVIDGGSTDETVDVLRSYGDRFTWTSAKDKGQVDAINKGLAAVTGDIVGWVNSDDLLIPGALAKVADAFRANPQTEWVHGRCIIIDEHDREVRKWVSAYKHYRCMHHSFANFLTEDYVSQMTTFWKKSMQDEVGLVDPSIKYAFDYEFFLRFAKRGDPIYIEDPIACFRWYPESKSGGGFVTQMRETNELALRYDASPWTRMRARAKEIGIVNIYRALAIARSIRSRV
jgi:glycosyltransferase involved in cell wall biosynthesis